MLFEQRYIGTVQEENTLNILLEFVPGGSIQSLLGRLGSFPEAVSITCSFFHFYDELVSEEKIFIHFICCSGH